MVGTTLALNFSANVAGADSFDFDFETENGITQTAVGEMRSIGDVDVIVMRGNYQYIDANGEIVEVSWIADENGYRAESSILPVAPAIPFPEQAAAVEAQIRFAAEEAASGSRSASASTNSYVSARAEAPAPSYTTVRVAVPAHAPAPIVRVAAPAPAPVVERVAVQPSTIYYKPIETAPAPAPAPVVEIRSEPTTTYYTPSRAAPAPARSAPGPLPQAESKPQPSYINYLYNN